MGFLMINSRYFALLVLAALVRVPSVAGLFFRRVMCSRVSKTIQDTFVGEWDCMCYNPPMARLVVSCTSSVGKIEAFVIDSFLYLEADIVVGGQSDMIDLTFLRPGRNLSKMPAVECTYEINGSKCGSCEVSGTFAKWDIKTNAC